MKSKCKHEKWIVSVIPCGYCSKCGHQAQAHIYQVMCESLEVLKDHQLADSVRHRRLRAKIELLLNGKEGGA